LQKSAISVFQGYKNVKCVIGETYTEGNITFVPFHHQIFDILKSLKSNDILASHFGLSEAMLQSGLSKIDKIKLSDLKKFKLLLLGHYHKPQHLSNEYSNLYYCGGFTNHSWNDKNETKRFLIYDTETLKVESVPMENQIEYKEFVIDNLETAKDVLIEAEKAKNIGHYVRIKKLIKDEIKDTPKDLLIIENKDEVDVTNRGIKVTMNLKEKLIKYLDIKQVDPKENEEFLAVLESHKIV